MSRYFILIALLAGAFACAESGGGLAEGGIGGSGISQGPITEFGSIFVNDIEWELDGAEVEIDGVVEPGTFSDADLSGRFNRGMVVRVEGTIDTSTEPPTGQAERVFFDHEIVGPVSDVQPRDDLGDPEQFKELTVLGKKILIEEGATNFSDGPAVFDTFVVGFVVDDVFAISGLVDDELGVVRATYVKKKEPFVPDETVVELKGVVSAFTPGTTTFMLGTVTVEFVNADLSDLPESKVKGGDVVEVKGTLSALLPDGGVIQALKIELDIPRDLDDVAVDEFSTTGFVNCTLDCADFFFIGNQRVDAIVAEFKNGDASMLEDGRRVKVEGELIDGLLKANEIEFKDQEARVHAAFEDVDDIDLVAGSFKLLGIEIQVIPSTKVIDFDLGNLMAGDSLEVRGIVNAPGVITAFRVRNRGIDDRANRLDGPVGQFDEMAGQFTIMGVTVFTDEQTTIQPSCFFESLNEGDFVEAGQDKEDPPLTFESDAATDVTLVKDNPCPAR
jgi:hypothetical protein